MSTNMMRKANVALLGTVSCLALGLGVMSLSQAKAQAPPPGCEAVIDTRLNCGTGATSYYGAPYTICKTASPYCCEYTANTKFCQWPGNPPSVWSSGYIATFNASYLNLTCGGTYGSICQNP